MSLRGIAAALAGGGHLNERAAPYSAQDHRLDAELIATPGKLHGRSEIRFPL